MGLKTFLFLMIFLVGCSPLNKTNPTSEPIQQPVATLPAVTSVPATAMPTLAPIVTVPAPEPEVIAAIDKINRLQGMQFLAPQQVWKILWPAPDQLLILLNPKHPIGRTGAISFASRFDEHAGSPGELQCSAPPVGYCAGCLADGVPG